MPVIQFVFLREKIYSAALPFMRLLKTNWIIVDRRDFSSIIMRMNVVIKNFDENDFSVEFQNGFTDSLLNAIRNVPQRKWNDELKLWQIPNTKHSIDTLLQNLYSTNYFNINSSYQIKENENSTSSFHSECPAHSIQQELEKTSASLKVKHYSKKTIECYLKWIKDFLSQSHADLNIAKTFAGWIYQEFGLITFIDSCVWNYANELINAIDRKYCKKLSGYYDYDERNRSTSHIHMMLTGAPGQVLDQSECLFFYLIFQIQ